MMTDAITLSDDERAFESYLDSLSAALQHGSREWPFRDYCTGLLLPDGRKSVEPMAARLAPSSTRTTHKKLLNFVSDGAWSDAAVLAAARSCRRSRRTARCAAGSWASQGGPRRAHPRSAWPASTDTVGESFEVNCSGI